MSRGLEESAAVMKLDKVRLDEAEQTNAGRTKVLRTRCADTAGVRLVSAGWTDRSSDCEQVRQKLGLRLIMQHRRSSWSPGWLCDGGC